MAWSNSKIFRAYLTDILKNTAAFDTDTDVPKVALYNDSITPDNDVTSANSAYGAGVWSTTGGPTGTPQVYEAGQWAQGGVALTTPTLDSGTADVVFFDADNTASGTAADLQNVFGALVYNDTITTPVADQGICYNYFGGAVSVVNGTFTAQWHVNGIWRITL